MSAIKIRAARSDDCPAMSEILCEIIAIGGTTAFLDPVPPETIETWMTKAPGRSSWLVAEDASGQIVGFQYAHPNPNLPDDMADIASFVRVGVVGGGIGSKLFAQTKDRLRALGFAAINASIRSDNESGLSYYARMGFTDREIDPTVRLSDGRVTGKHHKTYQL